MYNLNNSIPKVSVMIITYNHAPYIAQAIESVLAQETEYSFEINIIEDCSTDGTQDIIRHYKQQYPDKINAYLNPVNIGTNSPPLQKVFYEGFKYFRGEYIAILEGDDYWGSTNKLQKQVKFLEENPTYAATAHNTIKIYEDRSKEPHRFLYWEGTKSIHTIHDFVAMTSFFHTSSVIYRNVLNGIAPKQFSSKWSCDIFNTMAHVQHGDLYYFDEDMSFYRAHKGSNFSNMSAVQGRLFNIHGLRRYNRWLGYRYCKGFAFTLRRLCFDLLEQGKQGTLPQLPFKERMKCHAIGWFYTSVYLFFCIIPPLQPSVFWYGEPIIGSKGRTRALMWLKKVYTSTHQKID